MLRPLLFTLYVFANLYIVSEVMDFGSRWHSTTYVAKNVTVTLNDDSELKGTLTYNWNGDEILTGNDSKPLILGKYKMLQIPMEGQPEPRFPLRLFLPLFIYLLAAWFFIEKFYLNKSNCK